MKKNLIHIEDKVVTSIYNMYLSSRRKRNFSLKTHIIFIKECRNADGVIRFR